MSNFFPCNQFHRVLPDKPLTAVSVSVDDRRTVALGFVAASEEPQGTKLAKALSKLGPRVPFTGRKEPLRLSPANFPPHRLHRSFGAYDFVWEVA
jgi:hypothetical protein